MLMSLSQFKSNMKKEKEILYADKGKVLRRIADKVIVGTEYWLGYIYYIGGERLLEPKLEVAEDFEELTEWQVIQEKLSACNSLVEQYIREKYSVSDELAIQRQRDTKPEEFEEYFRYCEDCKIRAKQELGLLEPIEDEQQSI